jgi:3D (Asp-Asp-Asp) domain-containing protein
MKLIILFILLIPSSLSKGYILNKINVTNLYEFVTLTTYTASAKETDSTPNITASGFVLDSINPAKHRIIAVSRDIKKKYKFGTKVKILNAGIYNGIYYIHDVMNKRYKSRIDILINPNDKQTKLTNIQIIKI